MAREFALPQPVLQKLKWRCLYVFRLFSFFVVALTLTVLALLSPTINSMYFNNVLIFQPIRCRSLSPSVVGKTGRELFFHSKNGDRLSGLYFPSPNQNGETILFHHGVGYNLNGHAEGLEALARKTGAAIFAYDYAGFGKSEGNATVSGVADDARAAYDYLVSKMNVAPEKLVHYGYSMGTGPALQLAVERPCAGVATFAAFMNLKSVCRDYLPLYNHYPDFLVAVNDFESLQNVAKLKVPVLIMHGTADFNVQMKHGEALFAAAKEPKTFVRIEGGHHIDCGPQVADALTGFLQNPRQARGTVDVHVSPPEARGGLNAPGP